MNRVFTFLHMLFSLDWRRAGAAMLALIVAACSGLPSGGPRTGAFEKARWQYVGTPGKENEDQPSFVLVNVDDHIVDTLSQSADQTYFKGAFTDRTTPGNMLLGVGDVLRITIFEAGPGGLFVPASGSITGGNYITLPDQEVDQAGRVSIPYAGKNGSNGLIKVVGRQLSEVQNDIQKRLMDKAIEPQVIVTMVKRSSNLYSVMGEVNNPGRFNLEQTGVRVLDALSTAGGPKNNDYNTLVTIQRGASSATARLSTILTQSENNIFIKPGDLIAVKKDERYYNVMGATSTNNRIAFEAETVSVADAIAKAGGLNANIAEPETVVILRREEASALASMGITLEGNTATGSLPTVYRFNLREPSGMFLAQKMPLRHNDVVYVSDHEFSDISKLIGAMRDVFLIRLIGN